MADKGGARHGLDGNKWVCSDMCSFGMTDAECGDGADWDVGDACRWRLRKSWENLVDLF